MTHPWCILVIIILSALAISSAAQTYYLRKVVQWTFSGGLGIGRQESVVGTGTAPDVRGSGQGMLHARIRTMLAAHNDVSQLRFNLVGMGSSVGVGPTLPDPARQAPVAQLALFLKIRFRSYGHC